MNKDKILLAAMENSFNELIKVMNKKMDLEELDPEKVKISASAYRLAMDDAISIKNEIESITDMSKPIKEESKKLFFGVENKVKK